MPRIEVVWLFSVHSDRVDEFAQIYGPEGEWAQLFRRAPGYIETLLLSDVDEPNRFLVIDRWQDLASFEEFKRAHVAEYQELDTRCEVLTTLEKRIGIFRSDQ
jgi:heme-degrading monooxygenase HmoA